MEKGETKSEIIQENMGALNGRKNSSSMEKKGRRRKEERKKKERKEERKRIGKVIENILDDESSYKRIKSNKDFLSSVMEEKQKR